MLVLKLLGTPFTWLFGLIRQYPLQSFCLLGCALIAFRLWSLERENMALQSALFKSRQTYEQTVESYRMAQRLAEEAHEERMKRREAVQRQINERTLSDHQNRIAALSDANRRLLAQARANHGRASPDPVSGVSDASERINACADLDGLFGMALEADLNTARLIGLQDWVKSQAGVE